MTDKRLIEKINCWKHGMNFEAKGLKKNVQKAKVLGCKVRSSQVDVKFDPDKWM